MLLICSSQITVTPILVDHTALTPVTSGLPSATFDTKYIEDIKMIIKIRIFNSDFAKKDIFIVIFQQSLILVH